MKRNADNVKLRSRESVQKGRENVKSFNSLCSKFLRPEHVYYIVCSTFQVYTFVPDVYIPYPIFVKLHVSVF